MPTEPLLLTFAQYDTLLETVGTRLLAEGYAATHSNAWSKGDLMVALEHHVPEDEEGDVATLRGGLYLIAADGVKEIRRKVGTPDGDVCALASNLASLLHLIP